MTQSTDFSEITTGDARSPIESRIISKEMFFTTKKADANGHSERSQSTYKFPKRWTDDLKVV